MDPRNFRKCLIVKGGRVAQLVEQCPFKAWVAGSSPAALTRCFNNLPSLAQWFNVNQWKVKKKSPRNPRQLTLSAF
jgi:hypothetical protein